jgi:hypothetical protein
MQYIPVLKLISLHMCKESIHLLLPDMVGKIDIKLGWVELLKNEIKI